jgi:nucleoside-diphosphate-sugar epimerase
LTAGPWLVTGATGFLGRHLLTAIAARPDPAPRPLVALVRDPAEWSRLSWTAELRNVTPLAGSITDPAPWSDSPALAGLAGVFHLAAIVRHDARGSAELHRTNVAGTLHLVRVAAAHRCRMIFVSTSGTVGCQTRPAATPDELPDEAAPFCESLVGRWPYYRSKIAAEREARDLADRLGGELVILRPPVLLGPADHRFRSTGHVLAFLRGRIPFVIAGGMHFADVRDAAAALLAAMERPAVRSIYHLPGTMLSVGDFYRMVARAAGTRPPRRVLPFRLARGLARLTRAVGLHLLPEPALVEMASHYWGIRSRWAEAELGYRTRPPEVTVADTVRWLRAQAPAA